MAKSAPATSMPVDQAIQIAPGITHREADFFAQESLDRGFYTNFGEPGSPGDRDGNTPSGTRPAPRALTGVALPFKNLRGGR